jgi:hypothetical protein
MGGRFKCCLGTSARSSSVAKEISAAQEDDTTTLTPSSRLTSCNPTHKQQKAYQQSFQANQHKPTEEYYHNLSRY